MTLTKKPSLNSIKLGEIRREEKPQELKKIKTKEQKLGKQHKAIKPFIEP